MLILVMSIFLALVDWSAFSSDLFYCLWLWWSLLIASPKSIFPLPLLNGASCICSVAVFPDRTAFPIFPGN